MICWAEWAVLLSQQLTVTPRQLANEERLTAGSRVPNGLKAEPIPRSGERDSDRTEGYAMFLKCSDVQEDDRSS